LCKEGCLNPASLANKKKNDTTKKRREREREVAAPEGRKKLPIQKEGKNNSLHQKARGTSQNNSMKRVNLYYLMTQPMEEETMVKKEKNGIKDQ